MSDIVERLRYCITSKDEQIEAAQLLVEQIDEIESLRQRVKELEAKTEMDYAIIAGDNALICGLKEELAALKAEMKMDAEGPDWIQRAMQAEAQLDALKQQGEPVAMSVSLNRGYNRGLRWAGKNGEAYYKSKAAGHDVEPLYTSAPTIPEGYVMVPVEPTEEMGDVGAAYNFDGFSAVGIYKAMLAAAPKPEE